jgi:hypothetical protein
MKKTDRSHPAASANHGDSHVNVNGNGATNGNGGNGRKPYNAWIAWDRVPLGTMPDRELAARIGASPSAVSEQRNKRGIPVYESPTVKARKKTAARLLVKRTPVVSGSLDGTLELSRRVELLEARMEKLVAALGGDA